MELMQQAAICRPILTKIIVGIVVTIQLNPSLVGGGGHKVVAPSLMSSSAVNFDFHDPKPV